MKKNLLFSYLITISILVIPILNFDAHAQIAIDSINSRVLRIDPTTAIGTSVSKMFDEVEFIPLETSKESIFGKITQLDIIDDHFVIFDSDTKAILIFTIDGKYISKINAAKISDKNQGESAFWGFKVVENGNMKVIEVFTGKLIVWFDLSGKMIKKSTLDNGGYTYEQFLFRDSTMVISSFKKSPDDSISYEIGLTKNQKVGKLYFPFTTLQRKQDDYIRGGRSIYNSMDQDELFMVRYYSYDIYRITSHGLSVAYQLIFPLRNTLPMDFQSNAAYRRQRLAFLEKNREIFYGMSNIYKCGAHLFINLDNRDYDSSKSTEVAYNLNSDVLISVKDISPDSKSYFLPVTDAGIGDVYQKTGFDLLKDGYLYTSYSSLLLFKLKEQNTGRKVTYSGSLEAFFKTGSRESNPILIRLKPKTN